MTNIKEKKEIIIREHFPENQSKEEREEIIRQVAMTLLTMGKKPNK